MPGEPGRRACSRTIAVQTSSHLHPGTPTRGGHGTEERIRRVHRRESRRTDCLGMEEGSCRERGAFRAPLAGDPVSPALAEAGAEGTDRSPEEQEDTRTGSGTGLGVGTSRGAEGGSRARLGGSERAEVRLEAGRYHSHLADSIPIQIYACLLTV